MSASLISTLETFSRYNRRANRVLFDACGKLPDFELRKTRPAFFGTILGTLNHILVGDRLWLDRFTRTTRHPMALDEILYDDFRELRHAREAEDARIEEFVESLTPAFLSVPFQYTDHAGQSRRDPTDLLVTHMFNHQTHHRGQVHDMLMQTGVEPPSLDMHRIIRP